MKYIYVAVFIVFALLLAIAFNFIKRQKYAKLVNLITTQKYDEFDNQIESGFVKFVFGPYVKDYLKLNRAIVAADAKMIDERFAEIIKHRLNTKQKQDIYMKGFNYYVSLENPAKTKEYLDLVHTLSNEQIKKEADRIYDIYILKGHKYLDELLEETADMQDMYKGVNEFLISLMYENMGEKKKAQEYRRLSEKHIELLDRKLARDHKEKTEK